MQTTLAQFNQNLSEDPFVLQNPRMLKVRLEGERVLARVGSVVAHHGELTLQAEAERPAGVPLIELGGRGEAFLAHRAQHVHLIELEGDEITCAADRVLALGHGVRWERRELPGAVVALALSGSGWVALVSHGAPVLLDASAATTHVRRGAAIVWSGEVEPSAVDDSHVRFHGHGWVLAQPSDG